MAVVVVHENRLERGQESSISGTAATDPQLTTKIVRDLLA
jgi:hypothetical protein